MYIERPQIIRRMLVIIVSAWATLSTWQGFSANPTPIQKLEENLIAGIDHLEAQIAEGRVRALSKALWSDEAISPALQKFNAEDLRSALLDKFSDAEDDEILATIDLLIGDVDQVIHTLLSLIFILDTNDIPPSLPLRTRLHKISADFSRDELEPEKSSGLRKLNLLLKVSFRIVESLNRGGVKTLASTPTAAMRSMAGSFNHSFRSMSSIITGEVPEKTLYIDERMQKIAAQIILIDLARMALYGSISGFTENKQRLAQFAEDLVESFAPDADSKLKEDIATALTSFSVTASALQHKDYAKVYADLSDEDIVTLHIPPYLLPKKTPRRESFASSRAARSKLLSLCCHSGPSYPKAESREIIESDYEEPESERKNPRKPIAGQYNLSSYLRGVHKLRLLIVTLMYKMPSVTPRAPFSFIGEKDDFMEETDGLAELLNGQEGLTVKRRAIILGDHHQSIRVANTLFEKTRELLKTIDFSALTPAGIAKLQFNLYRLEFFVHRYRSEQGFWVLANDDLTKKSNKLLIRIKTVREELNKRS